MIYQGRWVRLASLDKKSWRKPITHNKQKTMKKTTMALEYEKPQVTAILLQVEQGFAQSSQLDDMKETEGEWAAY